MPTTFETRTAHVEQLIPVSTPRIWQALTTPEALKEFFFGADVSSDWTVGSEIRMRGVFEGKAYEDKGRILAFEPERRLSFSHWSPMSGTADTAENYHVVSFDLLSHGNQTTVGLSQANLTGGVTAMDIAHRAEYERNWQMVLDALAKFILGPQPETTGPILRFQTSAS